eukprot:TRINITY_DN3078_c0_g1_i1.p1 TRINITY_DN3078_c0_g1~~TRINITY_DN3078_c0_g1_i1.p1  ORF type:complete len:406 (-),score=108.32 TRINITY_DN3078_c0_g1_i1:38-1255(-)
MDEFDLKKCKSALVYHDPDDNLSWDTHFQQLKRDFFGYSLSLREYVEDLEVRPPTVFLCGSWQEILENKEFVENPPAKVFLVQEFCYPSEKQDKYAVISYRRLALRIPELKESGDRLVPMDESEDWYSVLGESQEWYKLMHANHRGAPAYRTGTYCSAAGPLPNSIWLQRCSTVFDEPTQVFGKVHHRLLDLQREAEGMFMENSEDPNVMLIQHYEPTAVIGAHSDKSLDLKNLVFRSFSAYQGFSNGKFDDPNVQVDPDDYRVWVDTSAKRPRPVIRFLTLKNKQTGAQIDVPLPPNWIFIMTDKTHREWTHEIKRQAGAFNRISVTARFSDTLVQYEKDGAVKVYRSLEPVGYMKFANREQSKIIDDAYYQQNKETSKLPDYSEVMLCTRNEGDLIIPKAFSQ